MSNFLSIILCSSRVMLSRGFCCSDALSEVRRKTRLFVLKLAILVPGDELL